MCTENTAQKMELVSIFGGYFCSGCGQYVNAKDITLHHKVPITCGGKTNIYNTVLLCRECHQGSKRGIHLFGYGTKLYMECSKRIDRHQIFFLKKRKRRLIKRKKDMKYVYQIDKMLDHLVKISLKFDYGYIEPKAERHYFKKGRKNRGLVR